MNKKDWTYVVIAMIVISVIVSLITIKMSNSADLSLAPSSFSGSSSYYSRAEVDSLLTKAKVSIHNSVLETEKVCSVYLAEVGFEIATVSGQVVSGVGATKAGDSCNTVCSAISSSNATKKICENAYRGYEGSSGFAGYPVDCSYKIGKDPSLSQEQFFCTCCSLKT